MTRCQHCDKLTHSEDLEVYFDIKDIDKVFELQSLEKWTPVYMYTYKPTQPNEYGKLKCGDIYIHFISRLKPEN